jgi:hypothetical protein
VFACGSYADFSIVATLQGSKNVDVFASLPQVRVNKRSDDGGF